MNLTTDQETVLKILARHELAKKFYWSGGTLLSHHYLHHRLSFDLDFFTDHPFNYDELTPFLHNVKSVFHDKITQSRIYERWEFVLSGSNRDLRFEFVHYNHEKKRLAPLTQLYGVLIDSLPDLAANKTMAYIDRNEPKDLLDVYTLLIRKKFTVNKLLALVEQKFGAQFPEFLFWSESTKSLERLETLKPYFLFTDVNKQEAMLTKIKHFFLDHGRDYLAKRLE